MIVPAPWPLPGFHNDVMLTRLKALEVECDAARANTRAARCESNRRVLRKIEADVDRARRAMREAVQMPSP